MTSKIDTARTRCEGGKGSTAELLTALSEADRLGGDLSRVAHERDLAILHALNGLANAKVLAARGEPVQEEALSEHLQHIVKGTDDLSVPHSNARTRRSFCLSAVARLLQGLGADEDMER